MAEKLNLNKQSPETVNQIREKSPSIPKSYNTLEGYIGNSWNGGIIKPIAYKKVMAGEKIKKYSIRGNIRMLTPKVPASQKLKTVVDAWFVPNSRVWEESEKYYAQKGSSQVNKVKSLPHIPEGVPLPLINVDGKYTSVTNLDLWRDSWNSTYIPRIGTNIYANSKPTGVNQVFMPMLSVLPQRGFKAIYNDMLRHKIYDVPLTEYKTTAVSSNEYQEYIMSESKLHLGNYQFMTLRGKRNNSYYTNFKTSLEGFDGGYNIDTQDLQVHAEWQKLIAEARTQTDNEEMNDWDIIAKLRGTRPVRDGKVRHLGRREIGHNYQQVAQTSYNEGVNEPQSQVLGATGAFSYTEFNLDMINYEEFIEDGYIHITVQTSADSIFETGIDRNLLNVNWDDEYRPDFKNLIDDVLFDIESDSGTHLSLTSGNLNKVRGFKRKFSENFKLPTIINGDITTSDIYETESDGMGGEPESYTALTTNKEFQFSEQSDKSERIALGSNAIYYTKNHWQDYTDLMINKNQAIMQTVDQQDDFDGVFGNFLRIKGHNQIFMLGIAECQTDLPIDSDIKENFKAWGEM